MTTGFLGQGCGGDSSLLIVLCTAHLTEELISVPLLETLQDTIRNLMLGPCPDVHMVEGSKRIQASPHVCDVSTALVKGTEIRACGPEDTEREAG